MNNTNNTVVLLRGELTKKRLDRARLEMLQQIPTATSLTLVIDSQEGGYTKPACEFVEFLTKLRQQHGVSIKTRIYNAYSAAAGIALVAEERELDSKGALELHIGSLVIESNEVGTDNTISPRLVEYLHRWKNLLYARLDTIKPGLTPQNLARLNAINHLHLTPDEWLQSGVVTKLF